MQKMLDSPAGTSFPYLGEVVVEYQEERSLRLFFEACREPFFYWTVGEGEGGSQELPKGGMVSCMVSITDTETIHDPPVITIWHFVWQFRAG